MDLSCFIISIRNLHKKGNTGKIKEEYRRQARRKASGIDEVTKMELVNLSVTRHCNYYGMSRNKCLFEKSHAEKLHLWLCEGR